jgi:hypothetical protein
MSLQGWHSAPGHDVVVREAHGADVVVIVLVVRKSMREEAATKTVLTVGLEHVIVDVQLAPNLWVAVEPVRAAP